MLKIVCISDTHTKHEELEIEPCDILLHAGDFSFKGREKETIDFLQWLESQPAKHKVFISGNHDAMDDIQPKLFNELLEKYAPKSVYLRHEMIKIEGLKIWGLPTTPTFGNWFFMADPESVQMLTTLSIIPSGIDILLSHGPSYGIGDLNSQRVHIGSKDLSYELERIKPKYHIFGHCHEDGGIVSNKGIMHINAAVLDLNYRLARKPIIFTIP